MIAAGACDVSPPPPTPSAPTASISAVSPATSVALPPAPALALPLVVEAELPSAHSSVPLAQASLQDAEAAVPLVLEPTAALALSESKAAAVAVARANLESAIAANTIAALDDALAGADEIDTEAMDAAFAGLVASAIAALALLNCKATEAGSRVMDMAGETGDNMNPIIGLYGAPVLSFAQCMEHTLLDLDQPNESGQTLRVHVNNAQRTARNIVLRSRRDGHNEILNEDQICAIYMYTAPSQFYGMLNQMLRDKRRVGLKPFAPYLRLLVEALHTLPASATNVFRGVARNLTADYLKDTTVVWWAISSTTSSLDVLQSSAFLGDSGERMLFTISTRHAVDIRRYSALPNESEVPRQ